MFYSTIKRRKSLPQFISHSSQTLMSDNGDTPRLKYVTEKLPLGQNRLWSCSLHEFYTELLNVVRTRITT